MKFSAAVFALLSLCHSTVNGVIHDTQSLRGGGGGGQDSSSQTKVPPTPLGRKRERRLVEGGYLFLFDDDVDDVEDFAIKLSNSRGRRADYVLKNTVHGVYMSGLSDDDVKYLQTVKGVSSMEQDHYVTLFDDVPQQEKSHEEGQEVVNEQDEMSTNSLAEEERIQRQQNRRRRRRRKRQGTPVPPPVRSPVPPPVRSPVPPPVRSPVPPPVQSPTPKPPANKNPIPDRQPVPWNVERVKGGVQYTGSNKAWVLDTGVMLNHPDLNIDQVNAYNVYTGTNAAGDDNGHGTQCAGIIAAIDNSIGTVGVAAGATIVPIRVFDANGQGTFAAVVAGVDYVASKAKPGDVANLSLGGPVDGAMDDAVKALAAKGVIVTIAAGNSYEDAGNTSPARVQATNVYTISSMNQSGRFSGFSNYGSVVDYACPGEGLKSTHINGGLTDRDISGTSFAAPHAAGVFLLGNASTEGVVAYDPDGNNDPCLVHGQ